MKNRKRQRNGASPAGFTLLEMVTALGIIALAAALVTPVLSALSSGSAVHRAAGQVANFVNERVAVARAGGGPSEIAVTGASTVIAATPEEPRADAAGSGGITSNQVLPSARRSAAASRTPSEENAAATLALDGATVETLYAKALSTGEAKDTIAVSPSGTCDDGLFVVSSGGAKAYVNVRGLSGRARVYDSLPAYLAAYYGVNGNETPRGK
jgi:prepilin-type N-terminal cleavage/methylation domain-containing protein